ncbi:hypothetical protein [Leptospira andrefontaineae]|uniref:Yip1 domain-containing protein n=1 Tax=Leptospira andrefontaineae TaxID=2484976 RepID=A0A4R9HAH6_9LEPT|nr:hypothetical protein [Leptospira andrefontaineae]TGK43530.1 hypothetical protein EHO65_02495 [Leptospira andrefontaineae]
MRKNMEEGRISRLMYMLNAFPYNIFLILGSLVVFEICAGAISYFALYIFGEKERSFKRILGIVFSSNLYVLLSFFPILILLNIIPPSLKRDMFTMVAFLGFVFMFFVVGLILQATFFIRMSKQIFQQNYGRAFLTWAFPLILFFSIIWISG